MERDSFIEKIPFFNKISILRKSVKKTNFSFKRSINDWIKGKYESCAQIEMKKSKI